MICVVCFVSVLGLALTSTASAELVGWWKMDDGSGTVVTDSSGNGFDADACGGGMCNFYGSPTVANCTFSGNSAGAGGGMGNSYSNKYSLFGKSLMFGASATHQI